MHFTTCGDELPLFHVKNSEPIFEGDSIQLEDGRVAIVHNVNCSGKVMCYTSNGGLIWPLSKSLLKSASLLKRKEIEVIPWDDFIQLWILRHKNSGDISIFNRDVFKHEYSSIWMNYEDYNIAMCQSEIGVILFTGDRISAVRGQNNEIICGELTEHGINYERGAICFQHREIHGKCRKITEEEL